MLESALRMSGVALVRDGQDYRLIPSAEAVAAGSTDWARDPAADTGSASSRYNSSQRRH